MHIRPRPLVPVVFQPVLKQPFSTGPGLQCPGEPFSIGWWLQPVLNYCTDMGGAMARFPPVVV